MRNGRRLTLTIIAWPEFDAATLEFIQAQLAASGIQLDIVKSPDMAFYLARVESGEFDLDLEAGNQNDANPMFLPALRFYSKSSGKTVRFFAPGNRFDAIIEAALLTDQRDETMLRSAEAQRLLLAISGLNFLGLGVQPPTAEWGAMLNDGRPFLRSAPQLMIYPGVAISLAVMAFNLLGDGLRDALDPRLH